MAYLHIIYPGGHEQKHVLSQAVTRVGRHSINDVQLTDDAVSRFHAEITRRKEGYVLRDLQSKNGVFIGEVQVTNHVLSDEDDIRIGNVHLHFHCAADESYCDTEDVELVEEGEERFGPIIQTKRAVTEPTVLQADWARTATTSEVDLQSRLRSVTGLCRQLLTANAPEDLLGETMDQIGRQLPFDRGCIMLVEGEEHRLLPKIARDNRKEKEPGPKIAVSMTIAESCLSDRSGVLCTDAVRDERFASSDSIRDLQLHSVLCVPLLGSERPLGIIHLESRADRYVFDEADLDYLMSLASELSIGLEHLQLRAERASHERMALVGQAIAGFTYHIKDILAVAESANSTIEEAMASGDFDKLRSGWGVVKRSNEKIARLVKDMLRYSKTEVGEPVLANVNAVVREVVDSIRPTTEGRGVALSVQLDENVADGHFDAEGLQRALLNIALNALEALEQVEQPEIIISTEAAGNGLVSILIQDNGLAFAAELRDRVFESFLPTEGARSAGLDLALARKLIVEMGGTIDCDSEPGLGTTFVISIAVASAPPAAEGSEPARLDLEEDVDSIG